MMPKTETGRRLFPGLNVSQVFAAATLEDVLAIEREATVAIRTQREVFDELRTLSEAATPGPWYIDNERSVIAAPDDTTVVYSVELADPTHDAALIAAAVNYLRIFLRSETPTSEDVCSVCGIHEDTHYHLPFDHEFVAGSTVSGSR